MKDFNKNLPAALVIIVVLYLVCFVTYIAIFQDKLFIAIFSVLGTLSVQRYLEGFRNKKEQQEFARLAISLINWRNCIFLSLRTQIISSNGHSTEIKSRIIMRFFNQISQDEVYKSMLKNIGVLPLNVLKYFFDYDSTLKNLLDSLEDNANNNFGVSLGSLQVQENLSFQIIINNIDGVVTMMLLSKQVLKDQEEFKIHKQFLVNEYWRLKGAIKQGENLPIVIFNSLTQIEAVFQAIGISDELDLSLVDENQ